MVPLYELLLNLDFEPLVRRIFFLKYDAVDLQCSL